MQGWQQDTSSLGYIYLAYKGTRAGSWQGFNVMNAPSISLILSPQLHGQGDLKNDVENKNL